MSVNEIVMVVFFSLAVLLLIVSVVAFIAYLFADMKVKKATLQPNAPAFEGELPIYVSSDNNKELIGKGKVVNNELIVSELNCCVAKETDEDDDNEKAPVVIERVLFDDAFEKLNKAKKNFINELIEYALSKEKSRLIPAKFQRSVMFRQGKLIVLSISRGEVIGKFFVASSDFKEFRKHSDTSIKEKPVKVKVVDETSLDFAKRLIDISYENLKEMGSNKGKNKVAV